MRKIFAELKLYFLHVEQRIFVCASLLAAIAIFINYYYGLNARISVMNDPRQILAWFLVFFIVFTLVYLVTWLFKNGDFFRQKKFILLLLIAPAIFAWKMAYSIDFALSSDVIMNAYWNATLYWPFKLIVVASLLFIVWLTIDKGKALFGLRAHLFSAKPYFLMLLFMIPLIALASTQQDFLAVYPKVKNISYLPGSPFQPVYKLLYELCYGLDFITIEVFFRGFLVLAFARFAGKDAILPMAVFYCTIHFGKPLGECISSYFGGILLGVVTYHNKNIYGGLIVHLGIAWLMELGGALGHYFQ